MSAGWTLKIGGEHDALLGDLLMREAGFDSDAAWRFQKDAEAISRLYVGQYVQDVKAKAMRHDLMRRIRKHMKQMENRKSPNAR